MSNKECIKKEILNILEDILEKDANTIELQQTFEQLDINSIIFIRLVV